MEMQEITIRVDPELARAYEAATPDERRKIDLLLSLRLKQVTGPGDSLARVMHEISEKAQARGLTEEELGELLRDDES
ncbi:MAG: hypothetical protein U0768_21800 [Anaerolineae bacterium]